MVTHSKSRRRRRSATAEVPAAPAWPRHLVLGGALGVLLLAVLLRWDGLSWWGVEMLRYLPLPLLALPLAGLVALSWRLGWRWRLLAAASLALALTEVMGLAVGRADDGQGAFRFMTYNVKSYLARRRGDGFAEIAWEIASQNPDVLVMQDAESIPTHPEAAAPVRAALAGRQTYVQGQYIVASRFPMKDCRSGTLDPAAREFEYVQCTLTIAGREVDLFTAHLISPREGLNAARGDSPGGFDEWARNFTDRLAQAAYLTQAVERARHPVVVAGDLNAAEHSPVLRPLLATGLRDAFGSAGLGYGYSYGHDLRPGFSFLRIDHVLVSRSIGVRACTVGGRDGSQHRPVIAELLVERL